MIDAQCVGAPGPKHITISGEICLGQASAPVGFLQVMAAHRGQPPAGGMLLAADVRIDNRAELFDKLFLSRDDSVDDESLFFLAYRRWREQLVDHVLGDFAAAVWDPDQQAMTLFRDPTGQRPLHYHQGSGVVAIASMPQGLRALENIAAGLNAAQLSRFIANAPQQGADTFYRGIARVEPAQVVRITQSSVVARTYWTMPTRELRFRRDEDYVAAFREQLDRATQARMRGGETIVAAHLSAGLDSGAVGATAARLAAKTGGRVLAITSAPRAGFAGRVPHGRIADESSLAAALVATYPNMEHVIVRTAGDSPLSSLEEDARLFGQPIGLPCNNVWWRAANAEAKARGANIMLTGEMGNLTLSAGGLGVLSDLIRTGRLITWLREMIALEKGEPRWRGLLAASFAPWVPRGLWSKLTRLSASGPAAPAANLLVASALGPAAAATQFGTPRANQSERELRWSLLRSIDPGNFRKAALLKWGIDERDPTADRRLVEFCFSLPPSQLIGGGETRRLARAGLADRLPQAILRGPRGYQYADWYEALDRDSLTKFAARTAVGPAASIIDFAAVDRLIAAWPPTDWASGATIGTYRIGLLRALSAGAFALNAAE